MSSIISLRQDKECLEMQYRVAEKDMNDLRDKLVSANRSLTSATGNISNQEALICQLRGKPPPARIGSIPPLPTSVT